MTLVRGRLEGSTYPPDRESSTHTFDLIHVPGTSTLSKQEVGCLQQGRQDRILAIQTYDQDKKTCLSHALGRAV